MIFKKKEKQPKKKEKKQKLSREQTSQKPDKLAKIKTDSNLNAIRVLLWIILGFIFLRGVFNIVAATPAEELQEQQTQFLAKLDTDSAKQLQVSSFAEAFAQSYCTYERGKKDDYELRLTNYAEKDVVSDIVRGNTFVDEAAATFVKALDCKQISNTQFDVTVAVDIMYTLYPTPTSGNTVSFEDSTSGTVEGLLDGSNYSINPFVQSQRLYYKIPVYFKEGRCAIEAPPIATAAPTVAAVQKNEVSSQLVSITDNQQKSEVNQLVNDFVRSLFEESQSKINYFLADTKADIRGLNTSLKLESVSEIQLLQDTNGEIFANVVIKVSDVNGSIFTQKFSLDIIKKDRYLIQSISLRPYK